MALVFVGDRQTSGPDVSDNFQVEYAPGKTVVVADALSRACLPENSSEISEMEMK